MQQKNSCRKNSGNLTDSIKNTPVHLVIYVHGVLSGGIPPRIVVTVDGRFPRRRCNERSETVDETESVHPPATITTTTTTSTTTTTPAPAAGRRTANGNTHQLVDEGGGRMVGKRYRRTATSRVKQMTSE